MKVGDIVKVKRTGAQHQPGIVIKLFQKKCWRTDELGKAVSWKKISPEMYVIMMTNNSLISLPAVELEVISEQG
jgi:hypothetical protein